MDKKSKNKGLIIIFLLLAFLYRFVPFRAIQVVGNSMYPTYNSGEFVIISKSKNKISNIRTNDIIVLFLEEKKYIKRVVAIEGDTVSSFNGQLQVNNMLYSDCSFSSKDIIVLGKEEFFVVGDNASVSIDSREYGIIKRSDIVGVVKN